MILSVNAVIVELQMENHVFFDTVQHLITTGERLKKRGMSHTEIRFQLYNNFVQQEYTYLLDIFQISKLPRIPLPHYVEGAIKHSFPNPYDVPYVGFLDKPKRRKRSYA